MAINAYSKKQERSHINNLTPLLKTTTTTKKTVEEEQSELEVRRRKDIMKIKEE